MDREFLDLYNRELSLLYEQAGDFAEQYPGIAERLGGLVRERTDPMIAGLLEGTAFLGERAQTPGSTPSGTVSLAPDDSQSEADPGSPAPDGRPLN